MQDCACLFTISYFTPNSINQQYKSLLNQDNHFKLIACAKTENKQKNAIFIKITRVIFLPLYKLALYLVLVYIQKLL